MPKEVWVELPKDWSMRVIEVDRLQVGDVVHVNKEQQKVEFIQVLEGEDVVLLRLSGEETRRVHAGFLYKLIALRSELEDQYDSRP